MALVEALIMIRFSLVPWLLGTDAEVSVRVRVGCRLSVACRHRDIAARNILVSSEKRAKIGLSLSFYFVRAPFSTCAVLGACRVHTDCA